jgi:hypothetical protein
MATKYTKWPQNIPNGHKIYQMATKYTKWPQNIENGHKIDQMVKKYINIFHCKTLQNLTQILIFGLKIYHLATLIQVIKPDNVFVSNGLKWQSSF